MSIRISFVAASETGLTRRIALAAFWAMLCPLAVYLVGVAILMANSSAYRPSGRWTHALLITTEPVLHVRRTDGALVSQIRASWGGRGDAVGIPNSSPIESLHAEFDCDVKSLTQSDPVGMLTIAKFRWLPMGARVVHFSRGERDHRSAYQLQWDLPVVVASVAFLWALAAGTVFLVSGLRVLLPDRAARCRACGYSAVVQASPACPECGANWRALPRTVRGR
jgi:hypothetical protein